MGNYLISDRVSVQMENFTTVDNVFVPVVMSIASVTVGTNEIILYHWSRTLNNELILMHMSV